MLLDGVLVCLTDLVSSMAAEFLCFSGTEGICMLGLLVGPLI